MAQLLTLPLAIALVLFGYPDQLPRDAIGWMFWISLPLAALLIAVACAMDRALRDLRHAWTLPLWPVFSLWASGVAVFALWGGVGRRGAGEQPAFSHRRKPAAPGRVGASGASPGGPHSLTVWTTWDPTA